MKNFSLGIQLQQVWRSFLRLRMVLFVALLVVLYGFMMWRIQTLASVQPTPEAIAAEAHATSKPKIDQSLVDKIKQLEDTNVSVKVLFDQARKNPFRE